MILGTILSPCWSIWRHFGPHHAGVLGERSEPTPFAQIASVSTVPFGRKRSVLQSEEVLQGTIFALAPARGLECRFWTFWLRPWIHRLVSPAPYIESRFTHYRCVNRAWSVALSLPQVHGAFALLCFLACTRTFSVSA